MHCLFSVILFKKISSAQVPNKYFQHTVYILIAKSYVQIMTYIHCYKLLTIS